MRQAERRHAQAGTDAQRAAKPAQRQPVDRVPNLAGDRQRTGAVAARQEHRELVAAEAGHQVAGTHPPDDRLRHRLQHRVAGETLAVRDPGERVVGGGVFELPPVADLVGDVVQAPDRAVRRIAGRYRPALQAGPEHAAIGAARRPFTGVVPARREGGGDLRAERGIVFHRREHRLRRLPEQVGLAAADQAAPFGADPLEALVAREGQAHRRRRHHRAELFKHLRAETVDLRALGPHMLQRARQPADLAAGPGPSRGAVAARATPVPARQQPAGAAFELGQRPELPGQVGDQQRGQHQRTDHGALQRQAACLGQRRQQRLAPPPKHGRTPMPAATLHRRPAPPRRSAGRHTAMPTVNTAEKPSLRLPDIVASWVVTPSLKTLSVAKLMRARLATLAE